MKNRTLCSALFAMALVGCTMNGKKMFEFGGSSTKAGGGAAPVANTGTPATASAVEDVPDDPHADERQELLLKMRVAYGWSRSTEEARRADRHIDGAGLIGIATRCRTNIPKLVAIDVADVELDGKRIPVNQLDAVVCTPLEKIGIAWDQEVTAAKKVEEAKEAAKDQALEQSLKAARLTGDRLAYAIRWRNKNLYGIGGVRLETPKEIKAARVIFMRQYNDYIHRYYRTEFAGDKIVSETTREYELDPGVDGFR